MNRTLAALVAGCVTFASAHITRADDLSSEVIDKVIRARAAVVRACYQRELARTPALGETKIVVSFQIVPTGKVDNAKVTTSSNVETLDACVVKIVKALTFPSGPTTTSASYPFKFVPGS